MRKPRYERKGELRNVILNHYMRWGRGVSATYAARLVGLSPSAHVNGMLSELCDEGELDGKTETMKNGWQRYVLRPSDEVISSIQLELPF